MNLYSCLIQVTGVKYQCLYGKDTMYHTDESDLDSSDKQPPSMGGWHALKLL